MANANTRPKLDLRVERASVEPDDDGLGLLLLLPDGEVTNVPTADAALRRVKRWTHALTKSTGKSVVVLLDWKNGAKPPKESP